MKHLLIILILLLCAEPVMAIEYPQEYYQISEQLNSVPQSARIATWVNGFNINTTFWDGVQYLQMEKQNILLEKQNELQAELVKAQWVETCYSNYSGYGNVTAWKSECANAGYPVAGWI